MAIIDPQLRASAIDEVAACDEKRAAAVTQYNVARAAAAAATDRAAMAVHNDMATIYSCQARSWKRWADAWRLIAERAEDA